MKVLTIVEAIKEVIRAAQAGEEEISFEDMPEMMRDSLPKRCDRELPPMLYLSDGKEIRVANKRVTVFKILKMTKGEFLAGKKIF